MAIPKYYKEKIYNEEVREIITEIMQRKFDETAEKIIVSKRGKRERYTRTNIIKNLVLSEQSATFDKKFETLDFVDYGKNGFI